MRRIVKWTALALAVIVVVGLPALVGVRPFIGPKARPLADRRFEPSTKCGLSHGGGERNKQHS